MMCATNTESITRYAQRPIVRVQGDASANTSDKVAEEVPIAMLYNDRSYAVMMATPGDLDDFALGFSLTEGLISHPDQLLDVKTKDYVEGISLSMRVAEQAPVNALSTDDQRLLPGRSGCGICGTRQLEDLVRQPAPLAKVRSFSAQALRHALETLSQHQPINDATGSMHAAAWADTNGNIQLTREDVGRHNALDKLIGALTREGINPNDGFLLISSRASYEMIAKAASAGVSMIAAISAPTALAIDLARGAGICLIGFSRPQRYNIYTYPERLT
ncbi:FdhD protein [Pseudoxanthomonas sp. 3HH-4]|nr:FdhD protein [Pseudoxanthomonas sp. 3HH-4]